MEESLSFVIREAEVSDAGALVVYFKQVAAESHFLSFDETEFTKTQEEQAALLQDFKDKENQIYLVACLGSGEIIGQLSVWSTHKKRSRHAGEFGIVVKKKYWGRGVGSKLLQAMLEWARSHPIISRLSLTVQEDNEVAIRQYKRLGFEEEGRDRKASLVNGKYYDLIRMGMLFPNP